MNTKTTNLFMDYVRIPSFSYTRFDATNLTQNVMLYNYAGFGSSRSNITLLYGYKSNYFLVFFSERHISQQKLAIEISSDLN
ncbi:MAG: hypothetical protein QXD23_02630 [Candidatus Micrarchaeaceae archaeon]